MQLSGRSKASVFGASYWTHSYIYIITAFFIFPFYATLRTMSFLWLLFGVFTTVIKLRMSAWEINENYDDDDDEISSGIL